MKKMPKRVRLLLDEWDVLLEKHEAALLAEDLEAAHKYGEELSDFMERHAKTLNIPDEHMNGMRQTRAKAAVCRTEHQIAEAKLKNSRRVHKESKEKYHDVLLNVPPKGKDRTAH